MLDVRLTRLLREEKFAADEGGPVQTLLPPVRYRRRPSTLIGLDNAKPETQAAMAQIHRALTEQARAITLYEFPDAWVTAKGAVITNARRLIYDSVIQEVNQKIVPVGMTKTGEGQYRTGNSVAALPGAALVVESTFDDNYGHWMVQGAVLLALMNEFIARTRPTLIMGAGGGVRMREVKEALLRDLGHGARVVEHKPHQLIRVERLLYVTPLHGPPLMKRPETLQALRRHLLDRAYAGTGLMARHTAKRRRLYLARKTNPNREIRNAAALEALLAQYGFETFFAEDHDHDGQIRAFAEAEIVIGVKGAAFTNVMFCAPNTKVIVFTPPHWSDPFFWCIAGQLGQEYYEVVGAAAEGGFVVDLPALEPLIRPGG
jgi:capsular polysaccharide biosynthesis protein